MTKTKSVAAALIKAASSNQAAPASAPASAPAVESEASVIPTVYNLNITQTTEAEFSKNTRGTNIVKFKGTYQRKGKDTVYTRTVMVQGKAISAVENNLGVGTVHAVRAAFVNAPLLEGQERPGQFISVVSKQMTPEERIAAAEAKAAAAA